MRRRGRTAMRRGFGRSGGPPRTWVSLNVGWQLNTATPGKSSLVSLQAPTTLALTSDPPEDLTVLRVVGEFSVSMTDAGDWTLALMVQDTDWTQSATFTDDADKRILWSQHYTSVATGTSWVPPGMIVNSGGDEQVGPARATFIDISPKVRLEPGKALYLVAYETGGTATFIVSGDTMRMLFQRSRRR